MLILTMPDGRTIAVVLVDVDRNKVRLGFDAPPDVRIYRDEIQLKIDAEAKGAG